MRQAIRSLDKNALITDYQTMSDAIDRSLMDRRATLLVLSSFALAALTLGAIGIYGVMAYSVRARSKEIGIRMAVGASPRALLRHVVGDGMKLAIPGIIVGAFFTLVLSSLLERFVFEVSPSDPRFLATATAAAVLVALMATLVPGLRAGKVDPIEVLSTE